MKTKTTLLSMLLLSTSLVAGAAPEGAPTARRFTFDNGAWVTALSGNGRYAVYTQYLEENTMFMVSPKLIDLSVAGSRGIIDVNSTEAKAPDAARVGAVANDGLCVGAYIPSGGEKELPAYWTKDAGWTALPFPTGMWEGGIVSDVTSDGKFACGKVYAGGGMLEQGVLWDLTKKEIIPTPGLPQYNLYGIPADMIRFNRISDDGKRIVGVVDFAYPQFNYTFVYDLDKKDFTALGFEKNDTGSGMTFTPLNPTLGKTEDGEISPNGRYVLTAAYMLIGNEVFCPMLYDMDNDEYTWFTDEESVDLYPMAVTNDGVVYAGASYASPIRQWSVRSKGYWVSFEEILRQKFDTTVNALTGYADVMSGTIVGMSDDALTIASLVYDQTSESYVATLPATADVLAADIDLLSEYVATPREGSGLSTLTNMTMTFTRNIDVVGAGNSARIVDGEGNEVKKSLKIVRNSLSENQIDLSFRNPQLVSGKDYFVVIPAGTVSVKGDPERLNEEIRIAYKGRTAGPLVPTDISPAEGTSMREFNMNSAPVMMLFDTNIMTTSEAEGAFYVVYDEGDEELLTRVGVAAANNEMVCYPLDAQYLYADHAYKLVIKAGSVTDLTGNNPNEEIVVNYNGIYEPEISSNYKNDFNDGSWLTEFLFYEGDHNEPTQEMQGWGFEDADSYPWWIVRDDNVDDWALTSHSMYSPAGKSDDWAILNQKYIADDQFSTTLIFHAQSYRKNKEDYLKVIVLESENPVSIANDAFIKLFKEQGVVVFNEKLSPGQSETKLAGDWREYSVSLDAYKGKYVYIAFVNQNEGQSAIFINDVELRHDVDFSIGIDNAATIVAANDVTVKGRVRIDNAQNSYPELKLTLLNADREVVDVVEYKGEALKLGDVHVFSFVKPLPLKRGCVNTFYVKAHGGDSDAEAMGSIANLYFNPEKRVVLEEQTGQGCTHCPLGHVMIERLEEAFGDRFIPVAIHTYTGDNLGSGFEGYSSYLNLGSAAPIATVNRDGGTYSPMMTDPKTNSLVYTNPESPLWWDAVVAELDRGTILDVSYQMYDSDETGVAYIDPNYNLIVAPANVSFALDADNVNYSVFSVLLEDGVIGKQANGHYQEADPLLGEWGRGGKYARPNVSGYAFNDVVRAYAGVTYNGTPGLIPSEVKSGVDYQTYMYMNIPERISNVDNLKVVTMVTDGLTGKVVNAVSGKVVTRDLSGVETVSPDAANVDAFMQDGDVVVVSGSKAEARLYGMDGTLLAAGEGEGVFRLHPGSYKGIAVVAVKSEGKVKTAKLLIK